jgi:hypothetical protein
MVALSGHEGKPGGTELIVDTVNGKAEADEVEVHKDLRRSVGNHGPNAVR